MGDIVNSFENMLNNFSVYLEGKMSEFQYLQNEQAIKLDALIQKLITIGILVAVIIIAIIIISAALKIRKKSQIRKREREADEAARRYRREEERLREQRLFYENQNKSNGFNDYGYDDYGYDEDKYGRGEYRNSWTPANKKTKSKQSQNSLKKKSSVTDIGMRAKNKLRGQKDEYNRTTKVLSNLDEADLDRDELDAIKKWDEDNKW